MFDLQNIQRAIQSECLDGWLFCNFCHRDTLSDETLRISPELTNSRIWICVVPAQGKPVKIVHNVESGILDSLPGQKIAYISKNNFVCVLKVLSGKKWGVHIFDLDAGTAIVLEKAGLMER
jgi:hypothetical protein